jgi:hypothetical protein
VLAIDRLRRIQAAARAGRALAPEDGARLASAIAAAIESGATIEAGLGLAGGWRAAILLDRRIQVVKELGNAPGPRRRAADNIVSEAALYAASAFQKDRRRNARPDGRRGLLFDLLDANDGQPPSPERVRKWLAA